MHDRSHQNLHQRTDEASGSDAGISLQELREDMARHSQRQSQSVQPRMQGEKVMTQDEIIEMARQAGYLDLSLTDRGMELKELEAFAKLVAEREREACAKVCETRLGPTATDFYGNVYAQTIRARGEA